VTLRPASIAVLAKEPLPGRSKTRLCPPLRPVEAAALAQEMLRDTLEAVKGSSSARKVLVLDGRPGPWLPGGFEVIPQRGADHAARIASAFADLNGPAVLIGMDTPQVTCSLLDEAVAVLLEPGVDAVLGPATDGGWWLAGLQTPNPEAFSGLPMSRPDTAAHQRRRFDSLGLHCREIAEMTDVDDWPSAVATASLAPATLFAQLLARLGDRVPAPPS
jgi:glycosyltransferase A (GT-A) superfamily protein (DUF2064 family)